jgi:hypothetical protein
MQIVGKTDITRQISKHPQTCGNHHNGIIAKPSKPSVRLTAFDAPLITK